MTSDLPGSLAAALAALQADLPHVGKGKTARVTSQRTGKTHSYDYADLADVTAAIMPLLAKHGLSFIAKPTLLDGNAGPFVMLYALLHVSGEMQNGSYPLPDPLREGTTPQAIGSAITYARRYCLCAVTGVAPDEDDDDAQAAEQEARRQWQAPPETRPDGSATEAELTRMDRGPVPGAERVTPDRPERTEWDAAPDTARDPRTTALRAMFALFRELGVEDKEPMVADISEIVGKPINSRADLSLPEITAVNGALRARRDQQRKAESVTTR